MSCTPANDGDRITPFQTKWRIIGCLCCFSVVVASFLYAPWVSHGPVFCPFRFFFGMPCPGCGLTRSFCAVSHGEIRQAMRFHLFGPFVYAACVCAIPLLFIELARRRRIVWLRQLLFSRRLGYIAAWSLMLYHGVRLFSMLLAGEVIPALKGSALGQMCRFLLHECGIGGT